MCIVCNLIMYYIHADRILFQLISCFLVLITYCRCKRLTSLHVNIVRATSHTRDREPVTIALQALSVVEKAELVQVCLHTVLEGPTEYICECKMDVKFTWIPTWHLMDHVSWSLGLLFKKPPLWGRPTTKDHGTPNAHNRWFILFYHVWGPEWIKIQWNSIWLRARSHMTSHYTWESVITLHDFGDVLGRPLDTFLWALTVTWSQLLARVWSCP